MEVSVEHSAFAYTYLQRTSTLTTLYYEITLSKMKKKLNFPQYSAPSSNVTAQEQSPLTNTVSIPFVRFQYKISCRNKSPPKKANCHSRSVQNKDVHPLRASCSVSNPQGTRVLPGFPLYVYCQNRKPFESAYVLLS